MVMARHWEGVMMRRYRKLQGASRQPTLVGHEERKPTAEILHE
jgi:hypothetical protein